VLPRRLLESIGVRPHTRRRFEMADGSEVELDLGRAWVRLDGHEEYTLVVFGEDALLGAVTLEEMRLAPDPAGRRLLPPRALLKRLAA
jgi:predicted aspartyl protease